MNDRRAFLKQIFGAGAAIVAAPLAKVLLKKPAVGSIPIGIIPMIRRTFPELLAAELVNVQPMSGPIGLAYAVRYTYEAKKLPWWKKIFKRSNKT
jgi:hypothetical protein